MTYQHVLVEKQGHIARVILNRPEVMNALNSEIMTEIEQVANSFLSDEKTRVVIFEGAGKHFSAGADLKQKGEPQSLLMRRRSAGLGARMIKAILAINQVTIAAIQGAALGGGACIPTACDFRIGSDDITVGYPEVNLGINLMWRSLPLCVRLIGPARAKKMIMLGSRENGTTLLQWGFLDELVARQDLSAASMTMAQAYAQQPPIAVQMIKQSINAVSNALDDALMHMDTDQNLLSQFSDDMREAIDAYFDKRDPVYTGD
jgi:enoyl-CoA hydratase/carnithine racemase